MERRPAGRADRFYPFSKTSSGCGAVKAKLTLSARTFACPDCGRSLDRDLNAAINLAQLVVAGSGPKTSNGRGADRKTRPGGLVAVKRQARTASAGKTGPSHRKAGLWIRSKLMLTEPQRLSSKLVYPSGCS